MTAYDKNELVVYNNIQYETRLERENAYVWHGNLKSFKPNALSHRAITM